MADTNQQIFRTESTGARHATAQAAILPGDLLEVIPTAGADLGKVRRHATAAARAAPLFADGNWQFGKGIDDAYAAGDTVPYRAARAGRGGVRALCRRDGDHHGDGARIGGGRTPARVCGRGGHCRSPGVGTGLWRSHARPHYRAHRRAIERPLMPVALETQALRGGPPPSILSPQGIAHLRVMASKTREAQLYTHATLLKEQWVEIDNLWLRVADQYMGAVMDLTSRGLTQTIPSLGIAASQYQAINRMEARVTDMRASAAGNNQRLSVTPRLVPLPFAFEDYEFDITELEAVQRMGGALDTSYTEEAQRSCRGDV